MVNKAKTTKTAQEKSKTKTERIKVTKEKAKISRKKPATNKPRKQTKGNDDIERIEAELSRIKGGQLHRVMIASMYGPEVELDRMKTIRYITNRAFILGLAITLAIALMVLL